jgi:hypothetical protein
VGDPPGWRLERCESQRNLDASGIVHAKRIGQWFASHQLRVTVVRNSPLVIAIWLALDQTQQVEPVAERFDEPSSAIAGPCDGGLIRDSMVACRSRPLYLLERFDVGVVHLDPQRRVIGMNDFARRILPVDQKQPFDRMVLSFHPEHSQPKVVFLLDQASQCPVANPPPVTMIINIPERVLLIKVTRVSDAAAQPSGYVLVYYDITEVVAADDSGAAPTGAC